MKGLKLQRSVDGESLLSTGQPERGVSPAEAFRAELGWHHALAQRHHYCLSLLLFEVGAAPNRSAQPHRLARAILKCIRSTDAVGWFDDRHLGVILPHCPSFAAPRPAKEICRAIPDEHAPTYVVHTYSYKHNASEDTDAVQSKCCSCARTCAGFRTQDQALIRNPQPPICNSRPMPVWKRAIDVLGSALGLALLLPLFLAVALLIKSVSKGPVFFKQARVGHAGKVFRLWKFRTYETNYDTSRHAQYMSRLINVAGRPTDAAQLPMKKLDTAAGLIPCAKVLRKACIDELPQLINVLWGQMSLVGPRPATTYEVEQYADWHKGRLDAVPGMTGLWQVSGKNRLTFNEMVRLDIQYSVKMSFWLDVKILLKTPLAILSQVADSLQEIRSRMAETDSYETSDQRSVA